MMKQYLIIIILFLSTSYLLASDQLVFDISNSSVNDFHFLGNSKKKNDSFVLNESVAFATSAIWYGSPVNISDGFETNFSFKISEGYSDGRDDGSYIGADGFALVFQTESNSSIGEGAGMLGYHHIRNAFVVE